MVRRFLLAAVQFSHSLTTIYPSALTQLLFFFFLRKISPELTTASPLLFLRKTGPELTSIPIFLYIRCGTPTTAWLLPSGTMSTPRIRAGEPWATEAERANLTAALLASPALNSYNYPLKFTD